MPGLDFAAREEFILGIEFQGVCGMFIDAALAPLLIDCG